MAGFWPRRGARHLGADYYFCSGQIEYIWVTKLADGPEAAGKVIAFQTSAAKEGGLVLFQDGSLKRLTAEEFAAAPKATPRPAGVPYHSHRGMDTGIRCHAEPPTRVGGFYGDEAGLHKSLGRESGGTGSLGKTGPDTRAAEKASHASVRRPPSLAV